MVNKKCLAGKTSVGNHLHRAEGGTCAKFQPNRTASFRDPKIFDGYVKVKKSEIPGARQGPSPHAQHPPLCKKPPAPSGYRAPGISWYTSSKGMPRHAHGQWALMQVGGR